MRRTHADWQMVTVEVPARLIVALYVRDAAGLEPPVTDQLPALSPAMPPIDPADLRSVASRQWATWWEALLARPEPDDLRHPERFLAALSELATLFHRCRDAAGAYATAQVRRMTAGPDIRPLREAALAELAKALGRPGRSASVEAFVLPLCDSGSWPTGDGRYLVSTVHAG